MGHDEEKHLVVEDDEKLVQMIEQALTSSLLQVDEAPIRTLTLHNLRFFPFYMLLLWSVMWETKDTVTATFSAVAFAVSVVSFAQKMLETRQARRKQLTEVLKELTELNLKNATFQSLEKKDGYPQNYSALIGDQRRFFVRQAAALSDSLGNKFVSSHEKNLIAATFSDLDYSEEAARFFRNAAENCPSGVDRGLALRNLGRFLYIQGAFEEGRQRYEAAIDAFQRGTDVNDVSVYYRTTTYYRWAESARDFKHDTLEALRASEKALEEASRISNEKRKRQEIERIDELQRSLQGGQERRSEAR